MHFYFFIIVSVCGIPFYVYAEETISFIDIPVVDGVSVPSDMLSDTSAVSGDVPDAPYAPDQIIVVYDTGFAPSRLSADGMTYSDTFSVSVDDTDTDDTAAGVLEGRMGEVFSAHAGGASVINRAVLDEFSTDTEILSFERDIDVIATTDALRSVQGIAHAQPNFIYTTHTSTPPSDDPLISHSGSWPFTFLNLAGVYDFMPSGAAFRDIKTPIVGIVDTNIKTSHPELAESLWRPSSCFDDTGVLIDSNCPNGGLGIARRGGARVITDDPEAGFGTHGTRMAGLAIGGFNNGKGGTGIAQHSKLMALAAPFSSTAAHRTEKVYTDDGVRMINAARRNGVTVLNLSWGLEYDSSDGDTLNCADAPSRLASGHDVLLYDALAAFHGVITTSPGNSGKQIGTTGVWIRPADYAKDDA